MSEHYHPHHAAALDKARLHIGEAMIWLENATCNMQHDDLFEASDLLASIREDTASRLSLLREAAQDRLEEHRSLPDYAEMHAGRMPYPDERQRVSNASTDALEPTEDKSDPYVLPAPNSIIGEWLIVAHGGDGAAESIKAFKDGERGRHDALAAVNLALARLRFAYDHRDIQSFITGAVEILLDAGAHEWESVLVFVNTAMDSFDALAPERQDILAWLYIMTRQRPDGLLMIRVAWQDGRLVVRLENTVIHDESEEEGMIE